MLRQQPVELRQFADQVRLLAPRQAAAGMDVDLLRREPLDATREAEAAADAGQGAKPVAQQRPTAAELGEAVVVMRFRVVNVEAGAAALLERVVEVVGNFLAGKIL